MYIESNPIVHRRLEHHRCSRTNSLLPHDCFWNIAATKLLNALVLLQFNRVQLWPGVHSRKEWFGSNGKNDVSGEKDSVCL